MPVVVPLSPGVRLIENDASITSLQDIYENYCDSVAMKKEDPILAHTERVRELHRTLPQLSVSLVLVLVLVFFLRCFLLTDYSVSF